MPRRAPVRPFTDWDEIPVVFDAGIMARISGYTIETVKKKTQLGQLPGIKTCEGEEWRYEKTTVMNHYGVDPISCMSEKRLNDFLFTIQKTLLILSEKLNTA